MFENWDLKYEFILVKFGGSIILIFIYIYDENKLRIGIWNIKSYTLHLVKIGQRRTVTFEKFDFIYVYIGWQKF